MPYPPSGADMGLCLPSTVYITAPFEGEELGTTTVQSGKSNVSYHFIPREREGRGNVRDPEKLGDQGQQITTMCS